MAGRLGAAGAGGSRTGPGAARAVQAGGRLSPPETAAAPRPGLDLAGAVLGAGLLLVLPAVQGLSGRAGPDLGRTALVWLTTLGIGAGFCAVFGVFCQRVAPRVQGAIAEVTGSALGGWAERVVLAAYLGGFVIGQAAIAVAAGGLLAVALGGPGYAAWLGALVLATAAVASARGVSLTEAGRRARLFATVAVALVGCIQSGLFIGAGLLPAGGPGPGVALFLVLFAGVGWESVSRIAPGLPDRRSLLRAVGIAARLVMLVCVGLAVLLAAADPGVSDWRCCWPRRIRVFPPAAHRHWFAGRPRPAAWCWARTA